MTAKDSPAWEIVLSHHSPTRFGRTFAVPLRGRTVHLCARCSGQLAGVVAVLLLFWVTVREGGSLFTPEVQLLFAAAPLPAAVDWLAQTSRRLESTNLRRVLSGGLLGAAVADLLLLVVTRQWELALAGVGVLIGYLGVVLLVLRATGGWGTVLREHFPGLEGDPIP